MSSRKNSLTAGTGVLAGERFPISVALRRALSSGYDAAALRADLMAGIVVGIVALPLSMALAIAVGVPPQHGLYTAVVAGAICAVTGGSKFQVTGPTAAFIVILAPIVTRHGLNGLLTAGMMAGVILLAMGLARLGRLIQFIPHPVTTGFTAGIATVIATLQVRDLLGLRVPSMPESYVEKVAALFEARGTASWPDFAIGASTLALLILIPRWIKKLPAPLLAIGAVSIAASLLRVYVPGFDVATIGSRFKAVVDGVTIAGIPPVPPTPMLPWGDGALSFGLIRELMPSALAIAILGAIESLLSAVIADGVTGKRHDPDSELVGQGIANIAAPFFGGIAATGALARTATNIRAGARSPIASVTHAGVVLLSILLLAPLVAYIPMAALAGLLLMVAWNMSELRHFFHTLRVAPKSDVFVLICCYLLTVIFDMVVAVSFGVLAASLLFMRRMAELTESRLLQPDSAESSYSLPANVVLYEVAGALFFGAAQNAMGALTHIGKGVKIVVLSLGKVPVIDATGLVALESALARLRSAKIFVIIAGPLPHPRSVFDKAQLEHRTDHVTFCETTEQAIRVAQDLVFLNPQWNAMHVKEAIDVPEAGRS